MTSDQFRVVYDPGADVLYLTTNRNAPSVVREGDPGLLWRYSVNGDDLVGVTVMDFDAYWRERIDTLVDQVAARFHVARAAAAGALDEVH
jgi:uncharacterized protein YuzE